MSSDEMDTVQADLSHIDTTAGAHRPIARPKSGKEVTPEMKALAEALAHPEGDPYLNGRRLGFYCENCG